MADRPRDLVDAYTGAAFLSVGGRTITPGQIRNWAYRGKIARHGRDQHRCTLYSLAELNRAAAAAAADTRTSRTRGS
jgi:hypothetical protein